MEKNKRFRIYGNILGTMQDVILFLYALEKNYNYILMIDKLLSTTIHNYRIKNFLREYEAYQLDIKKEFTDFYNCLELKDLISDEERLTILSVNFNSPGFWDVIGSLNPLSQIREYIQDRHLRKRDMEFLESEKKSKELANEKIKLENDILKLEITQTMINQLKAIGLSDEEIFPIIKDYYTSLSLLDSHIDSGRIINMEIICDDEI